MIDVIGMIRRNILEKEEIKRKFKYWRESFGFS